MAARGSIYIQPACRAEEFEQYFLLTPFYRDADIATDLFRFVFHPDIRAPDTLQATSCHFLCRADPVHVLSRAREREDENSSRIRRHFRSLSATAACDTFSLADDR